MTRLRARAAGALALLLLCSSALAAAAAPPGAGTAPGAQVFLVQNSGWMEPFYSDPASPYKALVTALVVAATTPGAPFVLASFNQSLPQAPSPKALLSARAGAATGASVAQALASLQPAVKPSGTALADTDLGEALGAAIDSALGGKPGLVWLFTNNRNSPNNDQATARRNREFYERIHQGGAITRALAFPLKMPVKSARYSANGLMVYVFAVGAQGASELDALLASGRIATVITERPARLKPLDRDTVRLVPRRVERSEGVGFSLTPAGVLRADIDDALAPTAKIAWNLENTMYPYTIVSAHLVASSLLADQERPIVLARDRITALAPGSSVPLGSVMQLPGNDLPSAWSLQAVKAAGSAFVLPGQIELRLTDQKLALSQVFRDRMAALFPGDPLPDIFTPPERIKASTALLPLEVRVHYGMAPLIALIAAALVAAGALVATALAVGRPRKAVVTVDGEARTMRTRAGLTQPIFDKAGRKVGQLHTTVFGSRLIELIEGAQVTLGR
ncbi:hypothetical protein [Massilia sp. DWR3-1-1]|uniref:hypothetical protein n=1 Tax=Massilia sp. DWR3-1-1 TaxID=2804559 RepID=UPI003CE99BE1